MWQNMNQCLFLYMGIKYHKTPVWFTFRTKGDITILPVWICAFYETPRATCILVWVSTVVFSITNWCIWKVGFIKLAYFIPAQTLVAFKCAAQCSFVPISKFGLLTLYCSIILCSIIKRINYRDLFTKLSGREFSLCKYFIFVS